TGLSWIEKFEEGPPKYFDSYDVLSNFVVGTHAEKLRFALPVYDPLVITAGLVGKYLEACDRYLAHSLPLESPKIVVPISKDEQAGELNFLRYSLAKTLLKVIDADSSVADDISGGPTGLRRHIQDYHDRIAALRELREEAANQLCSWLKSEH